MEKLTSEGKCLFCDKMYTQNGINKHLKTHFSEKEKDSNSKKGKSYLVHVKAAEMFLSLWVDGNAKMQDIDQYLRSIWLECCGHMSSFTDRELKRNFRRNPIINMLNMNSMDKEFPEEIAMNDKVAKTYVKNKVLDYEYDFGSTTKLEVKFVEEFSIAADKKIVLLSRNEPLQIMCHVCEKELATDICTVHIWEGEGMLCPKCAKKHKKECDDFADYANLKVINSPRMGVCGYEGGKVDVERNGIYKPAK